MSISTKRGDDGTTSLLFGKRVPKNHPRVMAYGRVDELSSALGLCRVHSTEDSIKADLLEVQKQLVYLMSELATLSEDLDRFQEKFAENMTTGSHVEKLTSLVRDLEAQGGGFRGWTQSGETVADAFFDSARTTCRRSERGLVTLEEQGHKVRPELIAYLNRLSDLLWLWGRVESAKAD